ncbi:protein of unknown function DUF335, SprT [Paraglaciecola sp. T6c]|uniref:SprT family zinc-dependent metalloprotease n=1 Tax=Pseudoalteromonas atlantica (strain T6c / ATCC BAA-1087) TaxID=3042615 RepID=UPI00005C7352|nr:SprT family zinc-dependent metalloprotease [Paraglaciecola sp. T6c]ABG40884.1 protein of unknown function DUF335, SprT [Paraglaciecola sp. T6c]
MNTASIPTTSLNQIDMQSNVVERVRICMEQANTQLQSNLAMPKIHFNQRGRIAGCARLQSNELRFNPVLLTDNYTTFINEVVPHEVAHLVVFNLYGRVKPHGKEWRGIMQQIFGLTGHTYHQMDVTKVSGKRFLYRCACGEVQLSIRRHNKVKRQQQQYICRQCHSVLICAETKND